MLIERLLRENDPLWQAWLRRAKANSTRRNLSRSSGEDAPRRNHPSRRTKILRVLYPQVRR